MNKALAQADVRELPAYTIGEAAGILRLPPSTLRAWVLGQASFRAVIAIADRQNRHLSFINLVEAFVLAGIRREHSIPLPKVRKAMDYLRRVFGTKRPLAEERFETDGVDLFVDKFGALIGATLEGQLAMREILRDRLKRVLRDPQGLPEKIVLFPAPAEQSAQAGGAVVVNPKISFGRPVLDGYGVRTTVLVERFNAGDDVDELAHDYGVPREAIENAIRCELRAA